jgi:hypothetical protein
VTFLKEDANSMRIIDELVTSVQRVHTRFRLLHNLIFVQQNANLFEKRQTVAQSQTTPHTVKQFAQQPVLRKLFDRVWGP